MTTTLIALGCGALAYRVVCKLLRLITAGTLGTAGEIRSSLLNKMSYDGLLNLRDAVTAEITHRRESA